MYNPAFKYKKTTQSTSTIAYNCVQYTYALDDGGSTGGNAGDTLYVYSYTDYDPLGLPLAGRSFTSNAYRYGYQGQFAEYDPESGLNNFELRQYDAALGRWFVPDPYRQHHSPYMTMGNNWVKSIYADGGWDYDGPLCNHTPGYRRRLQYYYRHPNFMKGYPEWERQRTIFYLEHALEIQKSEYSGFCEHKDRVQRETVGPDIFGIRTQMMMEGYSLDEANAYLNSVYGRSYDTDNCVYVNGGFYYPHVTYQNGETDSRIYLYPNEDGSGQGFSVTRTEYDAIKTWAGQGPGGDRAKTNIGEAQTILIATKFALANITGISINEIDKDVSLFPPSSNLYNKLVKVNNSEKYIKNWKSEKSITGSNAFQSNMISGTQFSLKFYGKKNGESNAMGIVYGEKFLHFGEAWLETLEMFGKVVGLPDDFLYDMHYLNSYNYLRTLNK